jgi:hypothetical protein
LPDIRWWDVVDRRMAGLKDSKCSAGLGDDLASELDLDSPGARFQARRARIIPDEFLTGSEFDANRFHEFPPVDYNDESVGSLLPIANLNPSADHEMNGEAPCEPL